MISAFPNDDDNRFPPNIIYPPAWCGLLLFAFTLAVGCAGSEPAAPEEEAAAPPAVDSAVGEIVRIDPRVDSLIPVDATIEKLADGFTFIEGPVWDRQNSRLFFSDVRGNEIYQWSEADGVSTFIDPVFEGDRSGKRSISSNGLTFDTEGRLIICEHGNRRISRLEEDGSRSVVVESYGDGQLNSPNDAVFASDGSLYFTDPSYGLEGLEASPDRELDFNGVYRLKPDGELVLLIRDQTRPNGIALSPDETTLYVANSDAENKVWMAYDIADTGASNARVFYDVNDQSEPGAADGLKVDLSGNLFATGPGGVWIISPDGVHLGTIKTGEITANVGWGDDGRTLYMTASTSLYRIKLTTEGHIPGRP
jgi:gluconolactonase